jgi:signal transduction histidine kinase
MLFLGLRLVTPSDGGRIAFYEDAWATSGVLIAPIDAPQPDLAAGDRVEAIADRSMEAWAGLILDPSVARPGQGAVPYLVERDGAQVATTVAWAPPAVGSALLEGWSIVLFSIAIAGVAAFVYARRPDAPAATALVLVACGAAGSSVPWFVGATTSDLALGGPFLLHALLTGGLYMLMWPGAVHMGLVFPGPLPVVRRLPWLPWVAYPVALGAYGIALAATRATSPSTLDWIGTWPRVQLAIVVPCLVTWLALTVYGYARFADRAARDRARWAALGAATSVVLGLVLFQLPELLLGRSIVPESWIGLIALPLPLGLAAGILRDRLFDIDVAVNRTLVYGSLTLVVIASYVVAASVLGSVVGPDQGYGVSLLSTGLAALVALPMRDVLQRSVNRLMYGERDEPWRAMRRLGQRLEFAAEPDRAFPAIVQTVADALRLPFVALEVVDEQGELVRVAEQGTRPTEVVPVPLVHGAETVGRLVLGVRPGERGFRQDEIGLLEDLGRQAGTAVAAMRLRDDLVRSRERLVLAREEERRRLRRDLHDGLGPSLAAIGMRAEASAAVIDDDPEAARRQLEALGADVREALADVRRLVDGLRPPALDELGLVGAIGQQAARLDRGDAGAAGAAAIHVECEPPTLPELPAAVEVAAYRIAVEAMTNAVRHAGASACRVHLAAGSQLTIEITDDGRGLPATPRPGTGMESMHERAAEVGGEVAVERRPEGGTRVLARLPIGRPAPA